MTFNWDNATLIHYEILTLWESDNAAKTKFKITSFVLWDIVYGWKNPHHDEASGRMSKFFFF